MSRGLLITLGVVGVLILVVLMVFGSYVSAKNQMVAKDQNVSQCGQRWTCNWSGEPI